MTTSPVLPGGQAPPDGTPGGEAPLRLPPGVLTGEAVLLELRPASFLPRALALALDALVLLALLVALGVLVAVAGQGGDADALGAAGLATSVVVVVGVPTAWEALSRGRSPGKAAAGLRVVRDDGGPVRARQALVRSLVAVGEVWALGGGPALVCSLANPQGKRIGDLVAGTLVVRERAGSGSGSRLGSGRPAPLLAPPELAAWARTADLARLPDALAVAARTVLARADRLEPASRARLLAQLEAQVRPLLAPPPPPGTAPERLLAAVLVERRERDRVALERARVRRDAAAAESRRLQGL